MNYLLDTSIIIPLTRDKDEAYDLLSKLKGLRTTSSICVAELYHGVFRSEHIAKNRTKLEEFLEELDDLMPFSQKEAVVFGRLKAAMKRELIPDMDLQIAATCIVNDLILVTFDTRHFPKVPGLRLY